MSPYYTPAELASRPTEHILEALSCRELGAAVGVGYDAANRIKQGNRRLEAWEERRLRDWLASCARDGMVTDHRVSPASVTSRALATLERAEVCA